MTEETKCCVCSKAKKIAVGLLLTVLTLSSVTSAVFSYQTHKTLSTILSGDTSSSSSDKTTITKKYAKGQTYEKAIATDKPVVAFFYADWCTYCKKFAPVFAKITKKSEFKNKLAVAYINCEDEKNSDLVAEYKIKGFPTVFLINKKKDITEEVRNNLLFDSNAEEKLLELFLSFTDK